MNLCTACDDGSGQMHADPNRGHPHADGEQCRWPLLGQPGTRCACTSNPAHGAEKTRRATAQQRAEDKLVELLSPLAPNRETEIRGIIRDVIDAAT